MITREAFDKLVAARAEALALGVPRSPFHGPSAAAVAGERARIARVSLAAACEARKGRGPMSAAALYLLRLRNWCEHEGDRPYIHSDVARKVVDGMFSRLRTQAAHLIGFMA